MDKNEIVRIVLREIEPSVRALVETVCIYESDTFSAIEEDITQNEVAAVVMSLINGKVKSMAERETLDGDMLQEELQELRQD